MILGAHAAHQHADALKADDASACPSTIGAASRTPCTPLMRSATVLPVGQRRLQRLHQQMAVEAEDLVEQLLAEAVHHRHDDDQRRDAEHDAEEGEPGNDRDESFLAARAQIAQRQHPFEWRERGSASRLAHVLVPIRDFTRFWRIRAAVARSPCTRVHVSAAPRRRPASADTARRLARCFNSTLPSARPFGPTRICQGMPMRSAVANFAPGRPSVSS